ncbi:MAG: crossover junction endodeoxyribonuclease RuvC [Bacteroidota bacterium]|jgi:crossover junction endodeoxyribonuclease RuvC|nr:crossover junction endodeoxyribonuclease RuvC [Bacteroidota bacterium]
MLILGVDPGSLVTGYGIIEVRGRTYRRTASGVITMRPSDSVAIRLRTVYDGLLAVIDAHHPDEFCIETAFYGKNVQSMLKLGQVRGVAILAAVHRQLGISEYSPREVKHSVTGTGAAAKQQVEYMVKAILGLTEGFRKSDEADGLALAICHAMHITEPRKQFRSWRSFAEEHPERIRK